MKSNIMSKYRIANWKMDYYSSSFIKGKNLKKICKRALKKKVKRLFEKDID